MLGCRETGNETYVLNLLRQRAAFAEAGVSLYGLIRRGVSPEAVWAGQALPLEREGDLHRLLVGLRRWTRQTGAAGVHLTYHAPFWSRLLYVVTIHDVSYRTHLRYHRLRNVLVQNLFGALSAWRARAAITVSQFCQQAILRVYPFLKGRLFVTPEAADSHWSPRLPEAVAQVRRRLGIGERYVLWVGGMQPRKNPLRLVEAFLRATQDNASVQLVLVGTHATPTGACLKQRFAEAIRQQRVILTGYVDDETLACLYSGCEVFAFPSLYEGFGLPVLEAMQCGAPVITSNVTALPEVAGDAAWLVDPTDVEAI
ncbi:MAG: glycosyltransferase family 4 protein, partial [Thermoflexales bacterium]|nr:glycosyltransferase family 4 protein [Thermoflexales bacterium]